MVTQLNNKDRVMNDMNDWNEKKYFVFNATIKSYKNKSLQTRPLNKFLINSIFVFLKLVSLIEFFGSRKNK